MGRGGKAGGVGSEEGDGDGRGGRLEGGGVTVGEGGGRGVEKLWRNENGGQNGVGGGGGKAEVTSEIAADECVESGNGGKGGARRKNIGERR